MHSQIIQYKKKEFSFAFKKKLGPGRLFYRAVHISLYAIKEREPEKHIYTVRTGLVISKKAGKAVERNKIRRRLRALARLVLLNTKNVGYYYVVVTHRSIMQANYKSLQKDLSICVRQIKLKILDQKRAL